MVTGDKVATRVPVGAESVFVDASTESDRDDGLWDYVRVGTR